MCPGQGVRAGTGLTREQQGVTAPRPEHGGQRERPAVGQQWVVTIRWDEDHVSPPIGPFDSYGEMQRFETEMRKRLRARGRKAVGTVKGSILASPATARSWGGL